MTNEVLPPRITSIVRAGADLLKLSGRWFIRYTVIPFLLGKHRDFLIQLWKESVTGPRNVDALEERYRWLYEKNPNGPAQTFLAKDTATETIIGCGSVLPWNKCVNDRILKAGVPVDFFVKEGHRTAGAALAIQGAVTAGSKPGGFEFLAACPNQKSFPIFQRIGYQTVGDAREWVKPLRTETTVVKYVKVGPLAKAISFAIDHLMETVDRLRLQFRARHFTSEITREADARFDRLWNSAKARYRVVEEKSAAFLNWRYTNCRKAQFQYFCLLDRSDQHLVGFVAFASDGQGGFIAGLFVEEPEPRVIEPLLLGFADHVRKEGWHSISLSYLGPASFEHVLQRVGFFVRKPSRKLVVYFDRSLPDPTRQMILNKENWFLFDGDMDI